MHILLYNFRSDISPDIFDEKRIPVGVLEGIVRSINISPKKGVPKSSVDECIISPEGLENDAHAGKWHRQVSLLAEESIMKMRKLGLDVGYGDFAENITTSGIELHTLPIGTRIIINESVEFELTQIGKECHKDCEIKKKTGMCIMPKEGIFARVIRPGKIRKGDRIRLVLPKR